MESLAFTFTRLVDQGQVVGFSCGTNPDEIDIAEFLIESALWQQNTGLNATTLFYAGSELAGYITLVASSIQIARGRYQTLGDELPDVTRAKDVGRTVFPAVLIGYMGVGYQFQRMGLGPKMIAYAIAETVESPIGVRMLTVDVSRTNEGAVRFWSANGFLFPDQINEGREYLFGYLDLYNEIAGRR